ncbi:hypothetical protein AB0B30_13670 [Streptomyces narbonensis]|uniref:Extensin n=1 Tax=Streptomyces narbonensis TaxID=67333 RepID=A0ABV3CJW9_9ACTN
MQRSQATPMSTAAEPSLPAPVTSVPLVTVRDLPRATAPPNVQRRSARPLASTRPLAPSLPGPGSTPERAPASPPVGPAVPLLKPAPAPLPTPMRPGVAAPTTDRPRPVVPIASPPTARSVARPMSVQRRSAPPAAPTVTPVTPAVVPVPQAAPQPAQAPPAPRAATVTRTAASATPSVQRSGAAPVVAPAPATPSADAESPTQLDELARRLVTPLSRLLRAELRADRERVGRLRDHGR